MTKPEGENHPQQSQVRNQPLQPAWEAFGGRIPFPNKPQTTERIDTFQTTRDTSGLPVGGRNRMDTQLGLGTGDRSEAEHTATTRPLPGGVTGTPGRGGTAAEGGQKPHRRFGRRGILRMAGGATAAVVVGSGIGAFLATRGESGTTPSNPTPDATQSEGSGITPTPGAQGASPDASPSSSVTTITPGTNQPATETVISKPEILGNGVYNSIQENPNINEAQQATIERLLGESTIMVIGEKSILSAKSKIMKPHSAPDMYSQMLPAPELHEVSANKLIKDAVSRQDELALLGLYFAYLAKNPDSSLNFEDYKSSRDNFDSAIWAYPGSLPKSVEPFPFKTGAINDVPFNKEAIVIWDVLDSPEKTSIYIVNDLRMMVIAENNVVYVGFYAHDPAAIDFNGQHRKNSELTELITLATTMLSKKEARNAGVSIFPYSLDIGSLYPDTEFDKLRQDARKISIPIRQEKEKGGNIGIHSIEGVSVKTGNSVKSISETLATNP